MASYYNSVVRELNGTIDGANKIFFAPTTFVAGTFRLVMNGQVYESNDDRKGWVELSDQSVELIEAPRIGDVLQAFYQDKDSEHLGLDSVKGSPFDPAGVLP